MHPIYIEFSKKKNCFHIYEKSSATKHPSAGLYTLSNLKTYTSPTGWIPLNLKISFLAKISILAFNVIQLTARELFSGLSARGFNCTLIRCVCINFTLLLGMFLEGKRIIMGGKNTFFKLWNN